MNHVHRSRNEYQIEMSRIQNFSRVAIDPRVPDRTMCIRAKTASQPKCEAQEAEAPQDVERENRSSEG
jgi:hypothetical protein